jgi:uncharacterized LabA/DUF88 family protein
MSNTCSNDKVWITVDDANLTATAFFNLSSHIDWARMLQPVRNCRRTLEVISSSKWMSPARQNFLERSWGAEVWIKPRNADNEVAASLLRGANETRDLILIAGDSGYSKVIEFLQTQGVSVEVWFFEVGLGRRLRDCCNVLRKLDRSILFPRRDAQQLAA